MEPHQPKMTSFGKSTKPGIQAAVPSDPIAIPALKRNHSPTPEAERDHKRRHVQTSADSYPHGPLLVWAKTRQGLCDSQTYYRSHQGGIYTTDGGHIRGILLDKCYEPRDFIGPNKIITTMGGNREYDGKDWCRKDNGKEPGSKAWWLRAQKEKLHIMCIIGRNHLHFTSINTSLIPVSEEERLKAYYIVLGGFTVVKTWQEVVKPDDHKPGYIVWKLMLQRINIKEKPIYWKDTQEATDITNDIPVSCLEQTCSTCKKTSPKAFGNASWVCLEHSCKRFFKVNGRRLAPQGLKYSKDFINWIQPQTQEESTPPNPFQPLPVIEMNGYGSEKALRMGMICPRCGCCSRLIHWTTRKCENNSCGFAQNLSLLPYPLQEVQKESDAYTKKLQKPRKNTAFRADGVTIMMDPEFVEQVTETDGDVVLNSYIIKNKHGKVIGSLHHARPSAALKTAPYGPDRLFEEMQAQYISLTRYPARCPGSQCEELTRNFLGNWGQHYEFGVTVPTQSFEDGPDTVLKALTQTTFYGQQAVEASQRIVQRSNYDLVDDSTILDDWVPYNEMLILGYMEKDKIGASTWHDDGEDQLDGTVSTISLGSPAVMALRIKKTEKKDKAHEVLKVQLLHGDAVTMCDTRLQAFTDHMVEPVGIRRFALTSRTIDSSRYRQGKQMGKLLKSGTTVEAIEKSGRIPARAAQYSFNGTTLAVEDTTKQEEKH